MYLNRFAPSYWNSQAVSTAVILSWNPIDWSKCIRNFPMWPESKLKCRSRKLNPNTNLAECPSSAWWQQSNQLSLSTTRSGVLNVEDSWKTPCTCEKCCFWHSWTNYGLLNYIKTTKEIPENLLNFRSVLVKSGFSRCKVNLATSLVDSSDCFCWGFLPDIEFLIVDTFLKTLSIMLVVGKYYHRQSSFCPS